MKPQLTTENLITFLEQTPEKEYVYNDINDCLICRFLSSIGFKEVSLGSSKGNEGTSFEGYTRAHADAFKTPLRLPILWDDAAVSARPRTYGNVAKILRGAE